MKFSTYRKLTLKIITAIVLLLCIVSIANSAKKTVKEGSLVVSIISLLKQIAFFISKSRK